MNTGLWRRNENREREIYNNGEGVGFGHTMYALKHSPPIPSLNDLRVEIDFLMEFKYYRSGGDVPPSGGFDLGEK